MHLVYWLHDIRLFYRNLTAGCWKPPYREVHTSNGFQFLRSTAERERLTDGQTEYMHCVMLAVLNGLHNKLISSGNMSDS